jgi:hypothetical protein
MKTSLSEAVNPIVDGAVAKAKPTTHTRYDGKFRLHQHADVLQDKDGNIYNRQADGVWTWIKHGTNRVVRVRRGLK